MPQNIGDNRINTEGIARIGQADVQRLSRYLLAEGDIVYSRRGDVERRALVRAENHGWLCGTGCLRVRLGDADADPTFVSYLLGTPSCRTWITQHAIGATMLNLNTSILSDMPLRLPPVSQQLDIAAVLGTLDDKIAANAAAGRTARELARLQFELIPSTSKVAMKLGDVLDLKYGKALPISARIAGTVSVVGSGGPTGTHQEALVPGPCVVVGRKGSVGSVYWIPKSAFPIDTTFFVEPKRGASLIYCYFLLQSLDLAGMNSDSAVPGLNRREALALPVTVPLESNLRDASARAISLFNLAGQYDEECRVAVGLRDSILPDLMSGRLRVKDAERHVEDAV